MMPLFSMARAYVSYWTAAKTAHGIHSPFVFDFYNHVWKGPPGEPIASIEALRREALADPSELTVTDLGAGSSHTPGKQRKIASLAKHSAKPIFWVTFLTRLLKHYHYNRVLELGTSLGFTSAYLAHQAQVTTVEGCPSIAQRARMHFDRLGLHPEVHVANIDTWLPTIFPQLDPFDVIFLDANHQLESTLRYADILLAHLPAQGCLVLDDIHWSNGMEKAWNQIIRDPRVTVSIDVFGMGIVFVRPQQAKEHFILR